MTSDHVTTHKTNKTKATLVLRVPELMKERGVSISELIWGARLSQGTAYHLANGEAERISFEVLASLCTFFELGPSDLFTYVSGEND